MDTLPAALLALAVAAPIVRPLLPVRRRLVTRVDTAIGTVAAVGTWCAAVFALGLML